MTPEVILRALADPERLAVAGALALGPSTAAQLAARCELPAARVRRHLTRLALEFEPGVRCPERDVNQMLRRFHDDYASLRRYLVDEDLLSRQRGVYWRSGGPVEV